MKSVQKHSVEPESTSGLDTLSLLDVDVMSVEEVKDKLKELGVTTRFRIPKKLRDLLKSSLNMLK